MYSPVKSGRDVDQDTRALLTAHARAAGERLVDEFSGGGVDLLFHLLEESAAHGIQSWLETHPCELVVTGSHGRRGVRRFLLGSVAELTVRHSPCSVLVVHSGPA
jgi:nucleotide-binding universal stress UspA family protein